MRSKCTMCCAAKLHQRLQKQFASFVHRGTLQSHRSMLLIDANRLQHPARRLKTLALQMGAIVT